MLSFLSIVQLSPKHAVVDHVVCPTASIAEPRAFPKPREVSRRLGVSSRRLGGVVTEIGGRRHGDWVGVVTEVRAEGVVNEVGAEGVVTEHAF